MTQSNMQPTHNPQQAPDTNSMIGDQLAGKHMIFKLASEEYGLAILTVREIIGLLEITRVPRTPTFIRGVINLRGKVIPVIDVRLKFGMQRGTSTAQNVIIVVQYKNVDCNITMGLLVDEVVEVLDIPSSEIEPTPTYGTDSAGSDFIRGVGKAHKRVIFLLDIGKILTASETTVALDAVGPQPKVITEAPPIESTK